MPNVLMAADHKGYQGFEQIKVSGLSMELQIAGINGSFLYNDNYYSRARLATIGKDESINKFNINILFPVVKYVNWENDGDLKSRVAAIANNNGQKQNNTPNSTNQNTTRNNQTNTSPGITVQNKKNAVNSNQQPVNSVSNTYNSTNKASTSANNNPVNNPADNIKFQQIQNDQLTTNVNNALTKMANDQIAMKSYNESINDYKDMLNDAQQLSGNYNSIQDIEREFASKLSSIRGITSNIQDQQNAKLGYAIGSKFNTDATEVAIGQGINLIGNIINSAKAEKDARLAQEELRHQKAMEIKRFEEKRQIALTEMRNELFKRFPDASPPPQQLKIEKNIIYFFAYIIDKNKIQDKLAPITVTNIFPVSKFDDGTFPYKVSITNKLAGIAPGNINLTGFFDSPEKAEEVRNLFIKLAESSQLTVKEYQLKTNSTLSSNNNKNLAADFWENGKHADSSQLKKQPKKDSFWED
ncbi:MAG: hypothetical protein ACK5AO_01550 [bacterium]